ncbi:MAG TPA: cytochrome c oxidase subunit II [Caulobacteraceae bacterium]|jgi:cytochrome c oxidase subunit 2|nr:cytochrome c oxidase subunit II [Caulobacteraceae bacterium]
MSPFYLPQASTQAYIEHRIFLTLLILSAAVFLLVLVLIVGFSIRYRAGSKAKRGPLPDWVSHEVEIGWTVATLFVFLFLFWWTISAQLRLQAAPANAFEIHVVAKQWMWKIQQPSGVREINTLHAPTGTPVKLVMTSQDVIHNFAVPAFRLKQDVLPGRYTEMTFQATEPGVYPLFCDQYCGLDHSGMIGQVVILPPAEYARWVAAQPEGDSLATQGRAVFVASGCGACHGQGAAVHAPPLEGLYGSSVPRAGGGFAHADEGYIRDAILLPRKNLPAGYEPVMPSFQGVLSEDQLVPLIAYIKSLKARHER